MTRIPRCLRALTFVACTAASLVAHRAAAQDLTLFYAGPTADMVAHFDAASLVGVGTPGFRAVEIDAASEAAFRAEASPDIVTLHDALQPGQALRDRVDRVRTLAGNLVDVELYLVDDGGGIASSHRFVLRPDTGSSPITRHVWPAAHLAQVGAAWHGRIGIGQWSIDHMEGWPGGWGAVEATVLHEIMHTQYIETGPHGAKTKWARISITYGADGGHWTSELLGGQALSLEEGLGTFFGLVHNTAGHQALIDFFRQDDTRYFLEGRSVLAGEPALTRAPRDRIRHGGATVWGYRWHDVPGRYLLFSESTSTGYHFFFWKNAHADEDRSLDWILGSSGAMHETRLKRFLTYASNRLALQMEAYAATPEGQAQKAAGTLVSSLFPYALLDVLTHFGMSEAEYKADHDRHFPDANPRAYAEYWNHRAALQAAARPHLEANPIQIEEAIEAVRTYLTDASRILEANAS